MRNMLLSLDGVYEPKASVDAQETPAPEQAQPRDV